jgi:hypothetical protein
MHLAAMMFGWPGAITAIALSGMGLLVRRAILVWVGAFVALPFMVYMFGTPRFWWLAAVAAPCHFGAAAAASRRYMLLGWVLFLPTPAVTWYIAAAISSA